MHSLMKLMASFSSSDMSDAARAGMQAAMGRLGAKPAPEDDGLRQSLSAESPPE